MGGRGGVVRFVSVLRWVAPVVWGVVVCREQPSAARALGQLSVCEGVRPLTFLAPPSSVLRLNPFFCMPKEGVNVRSPFQATHPVRSVDAAPVPLMWLGGIYSFRVRKY